MKSACEMTTISQKDVVETLKAMSTGDAPMIGDRLYGVYSFASELTGLSEDALYEMVQEA